MRKFFLYVLGVVVTLICIEVAAAGQEYQIQCQNPQCRYTSKVNSGGGMNFGQITGYCKKCDQFVYLTWEYGERTPEGLSEKMLKGPDPTARVWDPNSGQTIELYPCPKCSQLFAPIGSVNGMKYCPRCGQSSLVVNRTGLMYD